MLKRFVVSNILFALFIAFSLFLIFVRFDNILISVLLSACLFAVPSLFISKHLGDKKYFNIYSFASVEFFLVFIINICKIWESPENIENTFKNHYISLSVLFFLVSLVFAFFSIYYEKLKNYQEHKAYLSHKILGIVLIFPGLLFFPTSLSNIISIWNNYLYLNYLINFEIDLLILNFISSVLLLFGVFYIKGRFVNLSIRRKNKKFLLNYKGVYLNIDQIYNLERNISLPSLETPLLLHHGEIAVYHCATLRQDVKYGENENIVTEYPGEFIITTERIAFVGIQKSFEIIHKNITMASKHEFGLSFQCKGNIFFLKMPCPYLATKAFEFVRSEAIPIETPDFEPDENCKNINIMDNISYIDGMDGFKFEHFCADLLRVNGYKDVRLTDETGDQGVDITAVKDNIKYAIQCKNYRSSLNNKPIQEIYAGKKHYKCHVGVVMTNSSFTQSAVELANSTGILLWDRNVIKKMMNTNKNKKES